MSLNRNSSLEYKYAPSQANRSSSQEEVMFDALEAAENSKDTSHEEKQVEEKIIKSCSPMIVESNPKELLQYLETKPTDAERLTTIVEDGFARNALH